MPSRKFINPNLRPSTSTETSTDTPTLPSTETATFTSTSTPPARRKRGDRAFEKTHERVTYWLDRSLKARFEQLAENQGEAKSTLLDEAITDLLNKYQA